MELNLLRTALLAYVAASAVAAVELLAPRPGLRLVGNRLLWIGLCCHAAALTTRAVVTMHFPITSVSETLSMVVVVVTGAFLGLRFRWPPLATLVVVIAPLAFVLTLACYAFYRGVDAVPPHVRSALLPVHVLLAILGIALFCLAFAVSLVYLVQEHRLKAKRLDGRLRLPPLETLDQLSHRFLTWGLSLFTLAIVTGVVWAHLAWGPDWSAEPRLLWAVVTWIVYAAVFQGRVFSGMRGRRAATLTIVGFATLVFSLIGVNVFTPGRHGGGFG
jgi:cytochrome c-type biogenesis protein CcsB